MPKSFFQEFLDQLAPLYGMRALRPDKMGACQLLLKKENLLVLFEYDDHVVPNTVLASVPLGEVLAGNEKQIMKELLKGNQKSENVLSMQPDEPICFLHRRLSSSIAGEELKKSLASFTGAAKKWIEKVGNPERAFDEQEESSKAGQIFPYKKV